MLTFAVNIFDLYRHASPLERRNRPFRQAYTRIMTRIGSLFLVWLSVSARYGRPLQSCADECSLPSRSSRSRNSSAKGRDGQDSVHCPDYIRMTPFAQVSADNDDSVGSGINVESACSTSPYTSLGAESPLKPYVK